MFYYLGLGAALLVLIVIAKQQQSGKDAKKKSGGGFFDLLRKGMAGDSDAKAPPKLKMVIETLHKQKNLNRVLATGRIAEGEARPGVQVILQTKSGPLPAKLQAVETGAKKSVPVAKRGQNVTLVLAGVRPDKVDEGDVVAGR